MEGLQSSFGEWLRARRRALDLTQCELAQRVGCAEDTIGRIETGTRRPSKQVAALLADALGVPMQSHWDFVRFARDGGASALALERTAVLSAATGDEGRGLTPHASPLTPNAALPPAAPIPIPLTPVPRSDPTAWTPYLSTLPQPLTPMFGRDAELDTATCLL
ncbi:MAG TPA: helix-turn-helix transcriptional regulator, partial [Chloroflexia bacterium]|nr:helix-turn-helix transcriptional regulator [Chloroflexia bacterium]